MFWLTITGLLFLTMILWFWASRSSPPGKKIHPAKKPLGFNYETSEELSLNLPHHYHTDEIVALVKDPYWIYTYWEITEKARQEFNRLAGDPRAWEHARPVLRVHENLGKETNQFDIGINDWANSWYIRTGRPRAGYIVELGRILPDGRFIALARSNRIVTPADDISKITDPEWPPLEGVWKVLQKSRLTGEENLSSWIIYQEAAARKDENH